MTDAKPSTGEDRPPDATPYRDLLTKVARDPEQLTSEERARLEPFDRDYLVTALRRELAKTEAEIAGHLVLPRTVSDRRADDLVRLARKGELRVTALSMDEQDAINNTPGLWDRLWQAWCS